MGEERGGEGSQLELGVPRGVYRVVQNEMQGLYEQFSSGIIFSSSLCPCKYQMMFIKHMVHFWRFHGDRQTHCQRITCSDGGMDLIKTETLRLT